MGILGCFETLAIGSIAVPTGFVQDSGLCCACWDEDETEDEEEREGAVADDPTDDEEIDLWFVELDELEDDGVKEFTKDCVSDCCCCGFFNA
jgi:hypothetical protein